MRSFNLESIKKFSFYLAYFIFLFYMILTLSFLGEHVGFIKLEVCYFILFFKEILGFCEKGKINRRSILYFIGLVVIFSFFLLVVKPLSSEILLFLLIYCGKDINFRDISKFTIVVSTSLLLIIVLSSLLGYIPNFKFIDGGRLRYYLGFRHSIRGPQIYMNISFLLIYLKKKDIKLWHLVILMVGNYILYAYTKSRYAFFSVSLLIVIALVLKYSRFQMYFNKKNTLSSIFASLYIFAFPIFAYISIGLSYLYSPLSPTMIRLDGLMGERLRLANSSLLKYGFNFTGKKIPWVGMGLDYNGNFQFTSAKFYNYVDSVYVKLLQGNGLILFFVIMFIMMYCSYRIWTRKTIIDEKANIVLGPQRDYYLIFIMLILFLHFVFSDMAVGLHYNAMWFLIGGILMGKNEKKTSLKKITFRS